MALSPRRKSKPAPESRIFTLRGTKVMLDSDLAEIYGVETKNLNKAVQRNQERFPGLFMFQVTSAEWADLRFQIGTIKAFNRKYLPHVFTEHGAVMLAAVLNSPAAVAASIHVVEAFVRLRHALEANQALAKKLEEFGARLTFHDQAIAVLFEEIKKLAAPSEPVEPGKGRIGFKTGSAGKAKAMGRSRTL